MATFLDSGTGRTSSTSASWPELWNVDRATIPHWAPPTHAMQIFRYAEQGSIKLLVDHRPPTPPSRCPTSPGSARSSANEDLFVIVQDIFMTETAELADIVLPAATWGERTGTFTNADRTVHLSEQGGRAARRGAQRPRHLARLRPHGWTSATSMALH